jgi:Zn-finger nucleic acid-binding protein
MPEPEVRHPCPVCLGVKLTKVRLAAAGELTLDRCERCGGIWFDEGEVAHLRRLRVEGVREEIRPADAVFRMPCHSCRAVMERDAEKCPACGWGNEFDCPLCSRPMKRREVEGLHLDFCGACRGVWFDQIELAEIWNLRAESFDGRKTGAGPVMAGVAEVGAGVGAGVAEILFWNPELAVWGGRAVVGGARVVASGLSQVAAAAPQAIGGAVEVGGKLAGTVFEAIADIVASIFD